MTETWSLECFVKVFFKTALNLMVTTVFSTAAMPFKILIHCPLLMLYLMILFGAIVLNWYALDWLEVDTWNINLQMYDIYVGQKICTALANVTLSKRLGDFVYYLITIINIDAFIIILRRSSNSYLIVFDQIYPKYFAAMEYILTYCVYFWLCVYLYIYYRFDNQYDTICFNIYGYLFTTYFVIKCSMIWFLTLSLHLCQMHYLVNDILNITVSDEFIGNFNSYLRKGYDCSGISSKTFKMMCQNPPCFLTGVVDFLNICNDTLLIKYYNTELNVYNYLCDLIRYQWLIIIFIDFKLFHICAKIKTTLDYIDTNIIFVIVENSVKSLFQHKSPIKEVSIKLLYILIFYVYGGIALQLLSFCHFNFGFDFKNILICILCGQITWLILICNYFEQATWIVLKYCYVSWMLKRIFEIYLWGFCRIYATWYNLNFDSIWHGFTNIWFWKAAIFVIQCVFLIRGLTDIFVKQKNLIVKRNTHIAKHIMKNQICTIFKLHQIRPTITKYHLSSYLEHHQELCNLILSFVE